METFFDFVNDEEVIDLLVSERAKCAANGSILHCSSNSLPEKLAAIMPPRNSWIRLRKTVRSFFKDSKSLNEHSIASTIRSDIRKYRECMDKAPRYLQNLSCFVSDMQRMVRNREQKNLDFREDIRILPKFKERSEGKCIFRPITLYSSLEHKLLISLACKYLMKYLDPFLHEEILSYRPARTYHGEKNRITVAEDAVFQVRNFIEAHRGQKIYVAECDIQKFFDIINHDIVLECFRKLVDKAGIGDSYNQVLPILKAYLDSYSFFRNVFSLNDNTAFWSSHRASRTYVSRNEECCFQWVSDEKLLQCYSDEELDGCRADLGISQGGALSCLIANVVMNDVDCGIVDPEDPERLYVRFGDDVLMMHTNRNVCCSMIDNYRKSLKAHRLCYHPFVKVSSLKNGVKIKPGYWHAKSKETFTWGPGAGDAAEWIGFVGYEIRYTGEVRLRLSTLDKKFGDINKKYHSCIPGADAEIRNLPAFVRSGFRKMRNVSFAVDRFKALDSNIYSISQMKSLDRYRHRKIGKLAIKLHEKYPIGENGENYEVSMQIDNFEKILLQKNKHDNPYSYYHRLTSVGCK